MERKLAHIEQIIDLRPIKGADRIEVAIVLGWECVVKKGEFKIGDKIVYIEVDSIVPDCPEFEFLRERKFRIKTIKLKKQISQGLIVSLETLNKISNDNIILSELNIGDDVTEKMNIVKYLTPSEKQEIKKLTKQNKFKKFMMRYSWFRKLVLNKIKKESFPYWVSKTDEKRIQNIPQIIKQHANELVYVTEKIDYQSVTFTGKMLPRFDNWIGKILPKKFKFFVCSRNLINNNKESLYWTIAKKYNIEKILKENPTITIQGEQGDTNVQGNKYKISEPTLWVFNIIDHETKYHYNDLEIVNFCSLHGLTTVPILDRSLPLSELGKSVSDLVEFSKGTSVLTNIPREGLVVRCIKNGNKIFSFKIINPEFLLKYE